MPLHPEIGEEEAMGGDPTDGFEHVECPADEVRGGRRRAQRRQRRAQCRCLP